MIRVTSKSTIIVRGTTGSTVKITAGKEKEIHPNLLTLAIAAGAYEVGNEPTKPVDADEAGAALTQAVVEAINEITEKADPVDFDTRGNIKVASISAITGFKVTTAVRDAALVE